LLATTLGELSTLLFYISLTTEDRTLQAIVFRFHSCATTRPPSSDFNHSTTPPSLCDLPQFWSGTERNAWLLRTSFDTALVNKLVSLTWLSWALRRFQRFTLHYVCASLATITNQWNFAPKWS